MPRRTPRGENPLDLIVPRTTLDSKEEDASAGQRDGSGEEDENEVETEVGTREESPGLEADDPRQGVESPGEARAEPGQYMTFFLADEEHGVGILDLREIIEYESLTRVPMTPDWVRGVLNLRGNVVPVIDLALKFGLPATEFTGRTCVVIIELEQNDGELVMGVLVDRVSQVTELESAQIEPPPAFGTHIHIDYLLGIGRIDERFILLLDVQRVLAADELAEVRTVEEGMKPAEGEAVVEPGRTPEGEGDGDDTAAAENERGPREK